MNWRPILVTLAWLAMCWAILEAATIWACSLWVWTPIQRHYLPAYVWCSLPVITPASAEVRFLWKTSPHRRRELATGQDVDDSGNGTGMALSQSARDAGWKRLIEGFPQEVPTAKLRPGLAELAFGGESLWSFLLLPEACGLVAIGYGLYGLLLLTNRFMDWVVERSLKQQKSWWDEPSWNLLDECLETAQTFCSAVATLHRSALSRTWIRAAATNPMSAQEEPAVTPPSFAIPIFGVYNGTGSGYIWSEKDEIE